MSSELSGELVIVFSDKDQKNMCMNYKRKRKDTDVAEISRKKSRGTKTGHSTDPNMPENVSVRKRTAGDGQPRKRMRCSLTNFNEHSQVSLEDIQRGKRKSSVDADTSEKKKRRDHRVIAVEESSVKIKKRKANDDGGVPGKKMRSSDSSSTESSTNESNTSKSSSTESSSVISIKANEDVRSDDDDGDVSLIFNNVSPEEEKIYEMSSSGNTSSADFAKKYLQLAPIGAGGFGSVYAGFRKGDLLPVAIKHIPGKDVRFERVVCNGNVYNVILEVALMLKTAGLPGTVGQSSAVSLLDWYTLEHELILIMERPVICKDLSKYLKAHRGPLEEHEAKIILKQLVDAAIDMHSKGVFHRDIKLQNVLVELDSGEPRVRVIDFGCGSFSTEKPYSHFCGTPAYFPPEWFEYGTYWACPTTVWQLGALFFSLLNGDDPFTTMDFINNDIKISRVLSTECKTLLNMCLAGDPDARATLEDLQLCPALRETSPPSTRRLRK